MLKKLMCALFPAGKTLLVWQDEDDARPTAWLIECETDTYYVVRRPNLFAPFGSFFEMNISKNDPLAAVR